MADSNTSRAEGKARFQRNKAAFEEVFGNPFVKPEPLQGHYQRFRARQSAIMAIKYGDDPHGTKNPCQPSVIDFFCDVDNIVSRVLGTKQNVVRFQLTYMEDDDKQFTPKQRQEIEQEIGAELLNLKIAPVLGYFQTERKPGMMTRK
jgi:hypothetical protein